MIYTCLILSICLAACHASSYESGGYNKNGESGGFYGHHGGVSYTNNTLARHTVDQFMVYLYTADLAVTPAPHSAVEAFRAALPPIARIMPTDEHLDCFTDPSLGAGIAMEDALELVKVYEQWFLTATGINIEGPYMHGEKVVNGVHVRKICMGKLGDYQVYFGRAGADTTDNNWYVNRGGGLSFDIIDVNGVQGSVRFLPTGYHSEVGVHMMRNIQSPSVQRNIMFAHDTHLTLFSVEDGGQSAKMMTSCVFWDKVWGYGNGQVPVNFAFPNGVNSPIMADAVNIDLRVIATYPMWQNDQSAQESWPFPPTSSMDYFN